MQTILLKILHPNGQQYFPVQAATHCTADQLLQYLIGQGFLAPGKYRLNARGKALDPNRAIGEYGLQHHETLQVKHAFRPPQFEGGRGKGSLITNALKRDEDAEKPDENSSPRPATKKSLFSWLFS